MGGEFPFRAPPPPSPRGGGPPPLQSFSPRLGCVLFVEWGGGGGGGRGGRGRVYFVDEMLCDDLAQARVELLAVLVEHHGVGVPVQLLEAQATVVLPLDLLDGVLQEVPDVVDVLLIHRHLTGGRGRERGRKRERETGRKRRGG